MRILSACLSQLFVTFVQVASATMSRTDSTHTRGSRPNNLRLKRIFVSCPRFVTSHLSPCRTPTPSTTLGTCTPSLSIIQPSSPTSHTLFSEFQPCADPRHRLSGAVAELPSITGYGPKQLCWIHGSSAFHRKQAVLWTPGSCWTRGFPCQTPFSSTHRAWRRPTILLRASWHRLRTRTWMMTKFVLCWHHHCQEQRSKCGMITSLSLCTRKLDVQFISRSDKYVETCRVVFKQKQVESRNTFRQRKISSGHQPW